MGLIVMGNGPLHDSVDAHFPSRASGASYVWPCCHKLYEGMLIQDCGVNSGPGFVNSFMLYAQSLMTVSPLI
jgi:hypothetical protein